MTTLTEELVVLRDFKGHYWTSLQYPDKQVPEQAFCPDCGLMYAERVTSDGHARNSRGPRQ